MIEQDLFTRLLTQVQKPARYIGGEPNQVKKNWEAVDLRFALVFPDLYEIGMSHQGLRILYDLLNRDPKVLAERCYTPDIDMEAELTAHQVPLFSLESRRSLADFDVIGFTLPYELCYTNILTVLALAGIPRWAKARDSRHPLIIGGGSCSLNPEPVAEFFDAIVLGDGEEVIVELVATLRHGQSDGLDRESMLVRLAAIPGVYVPQFFSPEYDEAGKFKGMMALRPGYEQVRRRVVSELTNDFMRPALVPLVKPVHDRVSVEIARGCTRGCRFCQAGMIYRPVRERSVADIEALAAQGIESGGFDELALLSLSSGDYSCLAPLLTQLMDRFSRDYVSVSLPSMRIGTLTPEVMQQIKRVRKTGFTVAPEAGSARLREVINKGISEEDLLATCRDAFSLGWKLIKFYFMIGLPTETEADRAGIIALAKKAREQALQLGAHTAKINVGVSTFVPKPHTPFQWEPQLSLAESRERLNQLKKQLPRRGFNLKWHDPEHAILEGIFSRGDRRLAVLIEEAWQQGARLDGWSEHYQLTRWLAAAETCGIEVNSYLQGAGVEDPLPWDHLDAGVDKSFLRRERQKAWEQAYTPDCRVHGCQNCGLCDFKIIRPRAATDGEQTVIEPQPPATIAGKRVEKPVGKSDNSPIFRYRVWYARRGDGRFLSHLEMLQLIFRAVRRAGWPVRFSQGFNPSPRISFSPALPVGMESEVEYFDWESSTPVKDFPQEIARIAPFFPEFIVAKEMTIGPKGQPEAELVSYTLVLPEPVTSDQQQRIQDFLVGDTHLVTRFRKGRKKTLDLRPLVSEWQRSSQNFHLVLRAEVGRASTNPTEILTQVVGMDRESALQVSVKKEARRVCDVAVTTSA